MTYRWSRTWADKPYDFTLHDGARKVGRIYRHQDEIRWQWFLQLETGESGIEAGKEAAVACLIAAYERRTR